MSLDATRWAWRQRALSMAQKLILLSLADRAGADNTAFPSYETLRSDTGANRKTIWKALLTLKELGLIADTGERKGPTRKVVVWQLVGVEDRHQITPKPEPFQKRNGSRSGTLNSSKNGTQNLPWNLPDSSSPPARAHEEKLSPQPGSAPREPKTPHDWAQYFIRRCGYRIDQAITPKAMAMFRQWLAEGVTLEDVEDAALVAEAKLNGYPANPTYYRRFVDEVVLEKQRAKENPAATDNSKPGVLQNNRNWRSDYGKNRPFSQRKLSIAERATEQLREWDRLHGYAEGHPESVDITEQCFRVN